MAEKKIAKQVVLSHYDALKISLRSLRIRLGRSIISTATIILAIAFLMANLTYFSISSSLLKSGPEQIKEILMSSEISIPQRIWIVAISLVVCVMGITNAMLMSVMERSKEIGTMKCLGALDRFIVEMFLLESSLQGIVGSIVGLILGFIFILLYYVCSFGFIMFKFLNFLQIIKYAFMCILCGLVLSIIGAVYPAYKSAKLHPAEALRKEV